jgi:hypothetical protein
VKCRLWAQRFNERICAEAFAKAPYSAMAVVDQIALRSSAHYFSCVQYCVPQARLSV